MPEPGSGETQAISFSVKEPDYEQLLTSDLTREHIKEIVPSETLFIPDFPAKDFERMDQYDLIWFTELLKNCIRFAELPIIIDDFESDHKKRSEWRDQDLSDQNLRELYRANKLNMKNINDLDRALAYGLKALNNYKTVFRNAILVGNEIKLFIDKEFLETKREKAVKVAKKQIEVTSRLAHGDKVNDETKTTEVTTEVPTQKMMNDDDLEVTSRSRSGDSVDIDSGEERKTGNQVNEWGQYGYHVIDDINVKVALVKKLDDLVRLFIEALGKSDFYLIKPTDESLNKELFQVNTLAFEEAQQYDQLLSDESTRDSIVENGIEYFPPLELPYVELDSQFDVSEAKVIMKSLFVAEKYTSLPIITDVFGNDHLARKALRDGGTLPERLRGLVKNTKMTANRITSVYITIEDVLQLVLNKPKHRELYADTIVAAEKIKQHILSHSPPELRKISNKELSSDFLSDEQQKELIRKPIKRFDETLTQEQREKMEKDYDARTPYDFLSVEERKQYVRELDRLIREYAATFGRKSEVVGDVDDEGQEVVA